MVRHIIIVVFLVLIIQYINSLPQNVVKHEKVLNVNNGNSVNLGQVKSLAKSLWTPSSSFANQPGTSSSSFVQTIPSVNGGPQKLVKHEKVLNANGNSVNLGQVKSLASSLWTSSGSFANQPGTSSSSFAYQPGTSSGSFVQTRTSVNGGPQKLVKHEKVLNANGNSVNLGQVKSLAGSLWPSSGSFANQPGTSSSSFTYQPGTSSGSFVQTRTSVNGGPQKLVKHEKVLNANGNSVNLGQVKSLASSLWPSSGSFANQPGTSSSSFTYQPGTSSGSFVQTRTSVNGGPQKLVKHEKVLNANGNSVNLGQVKSLASSLWPSSGNQPGTSSGSAQLVNSLGKFATQQMKPSGTLTVRQWVPAAKPAAFTVTFLDQNVDSSGKLANQYDRSSGSFSKQAGTSSANQQNKSTGSLKIQQNKILNTNLNNGEKLSGKFADEKWRSTGLFIKQQVKPSDANREVKISSTIANQQTKSLGKFAIQKWTTPGLFAYQQGKPLDTSVTQQEKPLVKFSIGQVKSSGIFADEKWTSGGLYANKQLNTHNLNINTNGYEKPSSGSSGDLKWINNRWSGLGSNPNQQGPPSSLTYEQWLRSNQQGLYYWNQEMNRFDLYGNQPGLLTYEQWLRSNQQGLYWNQKMNRFDQYGIQPGSLTYEEWLRSNQQGLYYWNQEMNRFDLNGNQQGLLTYEQWLRSNQQGLPSDLYGNQEMNRFDLNGNQPGLLTYEQWLRSNQQRLPSDLYWNQEMNRLDQFGNQPGSSTYEQWLRSNQQDLPSNSIRYKEENDMNTIGISGNQDGSQPGPSANLKSSSLKTVDIKDEKPSGSFGDSKWLQSVISAGQQQKQPDTLPNQKPSGKHVKQQVISKDSDAMSSGGKVKLKLGSFLNQPSPSSDSKVGESGNQHGSFAYPKWSTSVTSVGQQQKQPDTLPNQQSSSIYENKPGWLMPGSYPNQQGIHINKIGESGNQHGSFGYPKWPTSVTSAGQQQNQPDTLQNQQPSGSFINQQVPPSHLFGHLQMNTIPQYGNQQCPLSNPSANRQNLGFGFNQNVNPLGSLGNQYGMSSGSFTNQQVPPSRLWGHLQTNYNQGSQSDPSANRQNLGFGFNQKVNPLGSLGNQYGMSSGSFTNQQVPPSRLWGHLQKHYNQGSQSDPSANRQNLGFGFNQKVKSLSSFGNRLQMNTIPQNGNKVGVHTFLNKDVKPTGSLGSSQLKLTTSVLSADQKQKTPDTSGTDKTAQGASGSYFKQLSSTYANLNGKLSDTIENKKEKLSNTFAQKWTTPGLINQLAKSVTT